MHKDLDVVLKCQEVISQWLSEVGLRLQPEKTKITHTLHEYQGNVGFDFLGFNIRQFPAGKRKSKKNSCLEIDHIIPKSLGGKNNDRNLQVLHRHCHDQKTAKDGSLLGRHDKSQFIEEPCELKDSCTVLKTS
jgi:RNA-directed DNA polymerase